MSHLRAPAIRNEYELGLLRSRMEAQDKLPPEWRALIYEYGQTRIAQLRARGVSAKDAASQLQGIVVG